MKTKKCYTTALILLIIFISFWVTVMVTHAHASISNSTGYITYTVQQGDTLWSIAEQNRVHKDIREDIYDIEQINKCNADIQPGQQLLIPTK